MGPETERQLVAGLRRGDNAAFDQIYEEFRARVYSFVLRLSRRPMLSEEILQETFLRLATRAQSLTEDTRLLPWLFTVARNLYLSQVRSARVEADGLDRLFLEPAPSSPTPFEHAAATQAQARLERALAAIPERYREALVLVAVEGLEPQEAAEVVGVSAEALRQRLSRARAMLREALDDGDRSSEKKVRAVR